MVEQGAEVAVPGLGGYSLDRGTVDGGCGGVSGAQRVAGDRDTVEAGRIGSFLDESADGSGSDALVGDAAGIDHAGEERARSSWADAEPVVERPDRVGKSIVAASDTDELTACVLIGLGAADIDEGRGRLASSPLICGGGYVSRGRPSIYAKVACGYGAMAGATMLFTSPLNVDASRCTLPSGIVQETTTTRSRSGTTSMS